MRAEVHEVFRAEEHSEMRRAHSVDHAGFEVEEIRARYVNADRGPVAATWQMSS